MHLCLFINKRAARGRDARALGEKLNGARARAELGHAVVVVVGQDITASAAAPADAAALGPLYRSRERTEVVSWAVKNGGLWGYRALCSAGAAALISIAREREREVTDEWERWSETRMRMVMVMVMMTLGWELG